MLKKLVYPVLIFLLAVPVVSVHAAESVKSAQPSSASAKADFMSRNPNNGWSFGYLDKAGKFISYNTTFKINDDLVGWCMYNSPGVYGDITMNFGSTPIEKFGVRWEPGVLCVNPGVDEQDVVIRWTSPTASNIKIVGKIKGVLNGGGKTSVRVLKNGSPIKSDEVMGVGFKDAATFAAKDATSAGKAFAADVTVSSVADVSTDVSVTKGTTIDFIFSKASEVDGSHVSIDLALDATSTGGAISYNLSPVNIPVDSRVASAVVTKEAR